MALDRTQKFSMTRKSASGMSASGLSHCQQAMLDQQQQQRSSMVHASNNHRSLTASASILSVTHVNHAENDAAGAAVAVLGADDNIAPLPCVVSSFLRRQQFDAGITLLQSEEVGRLMDAMRISSLSLTRPVVEDDDDDDDEEETRSTSTGTSNSSCNANEAAASSAVDALPPALLTRATSGATAASSAAALCGDNCVPPSATVLRGVAGSGKTTIAALACRDAALRRCFAGGGIAWINLGWYAGAADDDEEQERGNGDGEQRCDHSSRFGGRDELIDDFSRHGNTPRGPTEHRQSTTDDGSVAGGGGRMGGLRWPIEGFGRRNSMDSSAPASRRGSSCSSLVSSGIDDSRHSSSGMLSPHSSSSREKPAPMRPRRGRSRTSGKAASTESPLGFGRGLRPIDYDGLIECYASICHQLDIEVPHALLRQQGNFKAQRSRHLDKQRRDQKRAMEDARQIMANALLRSRHQVNQRIDRHTLIVLDDVWNPEDVEWFHFDDGCAARNDIQNQDKASFLLCHVLVTTRLSAKFRSATHFDLSPMTDEEASTLLLSGTMDFAGSNHHNVAAVTQDSDSSVAGISRNLESIALRIASQCGNLPSALSSCVRWIRSIQACEDGGSDSCGNGKNVRRAVGELADLLETKNFFENDPECEEELDLFHRIDRTLCDELHGEDAGRVLRLCLTTFAVCFRHGSSRRVGDGRLSVPVEYAKVLWERLLQSDVVSPSESRLFDEANNRCRRSTKGRSAFARIRDALVLLGILERVSVKNGNGHSVECLRIKHDMHQRYAEFLFEDEECDQLGLFSLAPRNSLREGWNQALADMCESKSEQWNGCNAQLLAGPVDEHALWMLPTYMIRGGRIDEAAAMLTDLNFIKGRLAVLGELQGTKCNVADLDFIQKAVKYNDWGSKNREGGIDVRGATVSAYLKIAGHLQKEHWGRRTTAQEGNDEGVDDRARDAAAAMHHLGSSLVTKRWWEDAKRFNEECLKMKRTVLGDDDKDVAATLVLLGRVHLNLKDREGALERYAEALRIQKATLGEMHVDVADTLMLMANLQSGPDEVVHCMSQALHIRRAVLGDDDEDTADALCRLGTAHWRAQSNAEALSCYEDALRIRNHVLGEGDSLAYGDVCFRMGMLYRAEEDFGRAVERLTEALRVFALNGVERDHHNAVEAQLFLNWATSDTRRRSMRRETQLSPCGGGGAKERGSLS